MKVTIHQTHHTIADFNAIFDYIKKSIKAKPSGLHVFPELFLTGYPLQDLCLQKSFYESYLNFIHHLKTWSKQAALSKDCCLLLGGLEYELSKNGNPLKIRNVIFQIDAENTLSSRYTKMLLPNYDIFDEKKYFTPGDSPVYIDYQGKKLGLLICEDMWSSSFHKVDPLNKTKIYN